LKKLLITTCLFVALCGNNVAFAGDKDPLFINMTSGDEHRAVMGIGFGANQLAKGHPLTVFLNDKAVLIASKANSSRYADQQKALTEIIAKGGTVIICPLCMKHYEVKEADLLPGIKVGSPDLTGTALFKDNTKTLSW
jgi:predicted peroxiredoxin